MLENKIQKDWSKLKDMICPIEGCGSRIEHNTVFEKYVCTSYECTFTIPEEKFEKLVNKIYGVIYVRNPIRNEVEDNLSELNNM